MGVLDLLAEERARSPLAFAYGAVMRKQYASVMPQAVSVWCRRLGHEVHYATFWGQKDPASLMPESPDILFVSAYTQASALAYALAKLYKRRGALTVLGGPHARSFPLDALRFFDIVVRDCDRLLVEQIVSGHVPPGSLVTSGRKLQEIPPVAERLPEIERSYFYRGRSRRFTLIGLLTSLGCPYSCEFCVDWDNPYRLLPPERLREDLAFLAERFPGTIVAFHDANFGVQFDRTLAVIESLPAGPRNPYVMECSLSLLRGDRIRRLRDTGCVYVAPGVESWGDDSGKAGVGRRTGREKLNGVVGHFERLFEHVPGLQANFLFGTDLDAGDEPVELTKEFMRRTPFVWPTVNIPMPFGGTPLYESYLAQGRILRTMPLSFYYNPHLVTTLAHYHPIEFYEKLIEIFEEMTSPAMLARRLALRVPAALRAYFLLRTLGMRTYMREYRRILRLLRDDPAFLAFHEGRTTELPAYYHALYERKLGRYAHLMSRSDRYPELAQPSRGADDLTA
ncbi:MAG: radical SAM protein [Acidobacteria bacterium]|nr:MAG: radical SAM protein [Acidobacteriota bacterium]